MVTGGTKADEVAHYLSQTSHIIEKWIRQAEEEEDYPVSRYENSTSLRKAITLNLGEKGVSDEDLFDDMKMILDNSVNPWTGRFVDKLYSAPSPVGMAAETLLSAINANAHVISASPMLCLAEEACVSSLATLCGWDSEKSDGLTMPGGSASNTLAIQTALNSIFPVFRQSGVMGIVSNLMEEKGRSAKASRPLIFTGQEAHYSIEKAAIACGLGLDCVISVPCNDDGSMCTKSLESMMEMAFTDSKGTGSVVGYPFFVNATAGSTVMGAFDDLERIAEICEKFSTHSTTTSLWKHVDGSWGGPVLFSDQHRHRVKGVDRFDSLTICPHKLMNIPHQCSFALFKRGTNLDNNALDAPYLFHDNVPKARNGSISQQNGDNDDDDMTRKLIRRDAPSKAAFGCGRRGDALKLYLVWLSKGSSYFATQVDQAISLAQKIVAEIKSNDSLCQLLEVSSRHGPVKNLYAQVCFRPSLSGLTSKATIEEKSRATRHAHAILRQQKKYAVDFAPLGGGQGDYIRMITHPGCTMQDLMGLVHQVSLIGKEFEESLNKSTSSS